VLLDEDGLRVFCERYFGLKKEDWIRQENIA
jgi:hypothetical protein